MNIGVVAAHMYLNRGQATNQSSLMLHWHWYIYSKSNRSLADLAHRRTHKDHSLLHAEAPHDFAND